MNVAIDKPVSQATIIMGCPAMERASEDYYPFQVMNQILGSGDLSSRLMDEIRIKNGLAYAVESVLAARKHAGSFRVVIQTKDESAKESIALAKKELERLQREPVSEAELQARKEILDRQFPIEIQRSSRISQNSWRRSNSTDSVPIIPTGMPSLINAVTAGRYSQGGEEISQTGECNGHCRRSEEGPSKIRELALNITIIY